MELQSQAKPSSCSYEFPRRHPRCLFTVPITLHRLMKGGVRSAHGITLDVSQGGVGALVQGSLQIGETVAIDLSLPERMLSTVAIVRHSSSVSSGFEFVGLTPDEKLQLVSVVGQS